ncbi:MAG: ParB/RepB/Spo0J family partition protein [Bacteroidales bacterium]|nr:ParB/RepB/Spo0J family partition protein [Bacteroidales bacterium]
MSKPAPGIGKGVSALFGEIPDADQLRKPIGYVNKEIAGPQSRTTNSDVVRIPVEMIEPNPYQPRLSFDRESLEELAGSIRSLGLIQPITVRRCDGSHYQIISGERRFRACSLNGMKMIPAYVRDANDQGMLEMAIVENIQRENLDPIEEALSYRRLIEECHLTQEEMALRVGKKRASIANSLRLLNLPAKPQHDLKVGLLSVGHAKVILGVDDPELQEELSDRVIAKGWSVRMLEDAVRRILAEGVAAPKQKREAPSLPESYSKLAESLSRYVSGDNVSLRYSGSGKGTLTVRFSSDKEVSELLETLERQN